MHLRKFVNLQFENIEDCRSKSTKNSNDKMFKLQRVEVNVQGSFEEN